MAKPKSHTQPDTASKQPWPSQRPEDYEYRTLQDIEADRRIQAVEDALFLGSLLRGSRAMEA